MIRYYELNADGTVKGNYATNQPDKTLYPLEAALNDKFYMRDGVPGTTWIVNEAAVNAASALASAQQVKEQDFVDSFPKWSDVKAEIEAIELAADALTQPTKGIIKDILRRLKKNSRVINHLVGRPIDAPVTII